MAKQKETGTGSRQGRQNTWALPLPHLTPPDLLCKRLPSSLSLSRSLAGHVGVVVLCECRVSLHALMPVTLFLS